MLRRFTDFIEKNELFDRKDSILLAVSGGIDSMVMLDLFLQAKIKVGVAHCNFQLRGTESDEDEAWVRQSCHQAKVEFFSTRFETKNYAEKAGLSIQMGARELRYAWFKEILARENYFALATAHHLNDNLETVLLRWVRGMSPGSLTGIPLKSDSVVRPLLFAKRSDIEQYAKERKLVWREDTSNAGDDYQRNFIRHQVVPKLKEVNPSLEETFAESLERIKGGNELMQRGLEQLKDSMTQTEGHNFMIDKNLLGLLKNPAYVCYELLLPFGFSWERCVQLVESLSAQSGKRFLSASHEAVIDRDHIIVSPLKELLHDILIEEGQDKAALGSWQLKLKEVTGNKIPPGSDHAALDKSKLKFPLLWRKWRSGDSFYPLGMGHRKKLSDFLIDEKVPVSNKNLVTLIESGGEVIWIVGYRIDDRYKVTPKTKTVLELEVNAI